MKYEDIIHSRNFKSPIFINFNSFGKIYTINIGTVKMDPTKMKRAWSAKNKNKNREKERVTHKS